ncbi:MAG: CotH kinase family protein [Bacilli bacterium]|nr:CotH kinase family protein [Bacilli bacterium]
MKNIKRIVMTLSIAMLLSSCTAIDFSSPSTSNDSISSEDSISTSATSSSEPEETLDDMIYRKLFTPSSDVRFSLKISKESIVALNEYDNDPDITTYFDIYWPADLTIKIDDQELIYSQVGVRMKGNTNSRGEICDENGEITNMRHLKVSFKETFDDEMYESGMPGNPFFVDWSGKSSLRKERKNRTLGGMEKIDLKWNASLDLSKTKQSYALKTFRENGIIAPNDNVINFTLGVYSSSGAYIDGFTDTFDMIECIDEIFINRYFPANEQGGDLYKCLSHDSVLADLSNTTTSELGIEDNYTGYHPTYDLKTNKKTSDMSAMYNMIDVVSQNTAYRGAATTTIKSKLEATIDIDYFLKMESISYLMGNPDDQRFNYNNYYLYFARTSKKAYYIPYDWDWCFGCTYIAGNAISYTPFQIATTKQLQSTNPLYYRTIISSSFSSSSKLGKSSMYPLISEYRDVYAQYLISFKSSILSNSRFQNYLNELHYVR